MKMKRRVFELGIIIIVGVISIFGAYQPLRNFDVEMYQLNATLVRSGLNLYAVQPYYNYAPLWMYLNWIQAEIAALLRQSFAPVARISLLVILVITSMVYASLSTRR